MSDHAPFKGGLSPSYDLVQSTCMQNSTILALAVPEISLGASTFKVGYRSRDPDHASFKGNLSSLCWA